MLRQVVEGAEGEPAPIVMSADELKQQAVVTMVADELWAALTNTVTRCGPDTRSVCPHRGRTADESVECRCGV